MPKTRCLKRDEFFPFPPRTGAIPRRRQAIRGKGKRPLSHLLRVNVLSPATPATMSSHFFMYAHPMGIEAVDKEGSTAFFVEFGIKQFRRKVFICSGRTHAGNFNQKQST